MADTTYSVNNDTGTPDPYAVLVDVDAGGAGHPYSKVEFGPSGTQTKVTATTGLPVNPVQETAGVGVGAAADAEAVGDGSVIAILKRIRTLLAGTLTVGDGGGSLTVDAAQLPAALVGGRLDVNVGATALPSVVTVEAAYTAAQTDAAIVTVAAPNRIVVTRVLVTCDNANTVDVGLRIGFGTVNTPTTTGVVASHPGIPPGGGFNSGDGSGVLGIGASDEDLRITSEVPTSGSLRVVVSYYLTT